MSNLDGFLLSLMFATATLAMPGEAGMGKAHALPFDGAWSGLITMDRGNCDPIVCGKRATERIPLWNEPEAERYHRKCVG
jgi:hypothetical protein